VSVINRSPPKWINDTLAWEELKSYPGLDQRVKKVLVYKTLDNYELMYLIVSRPLFHTNTFAWPVHVAFRDQLHDRFGTTRSIWFGITDDGIGSPWPKLDDRRHLGEFPKFNESHVRSGAPDYVVMTRDWKPKSALPR